MQKKAVLLVDDDPSIRKLLKAALRKNGYETLECSSGEKALEIIAKENLDAVILDIVLPEMDGLDTLKKIRNNHHSATIPVIMLTCKDSEAETVLGFELGADDCLNKPVRYHELLARLKNIFRRASNAAQFKKIINIHGLTIDLETRTLLINDTSVILTYIEFELLALMAKNPGKVFSRDFLLNTLWHDEQIVETRTVDVHIRRLRKKLSEHGLNPSIIETIRSVGYRLSKPVSD